MPLIFIFVASCDSGDRPALSETARFGDVFVPVDTIALEEADTVINVISYVTPESDGYLIADGQEHKIRKYTRDGQLVWQTGQHGDGPGEFRNPRFLLRLKDRRLLAGQIEQRIALFDSLANHITTHTTALHRIADATVLGSGQVVVSALIDADFESPRLHLIDPHDAGIIRSMFSPFQNTSIPDAAIIGGFARVAAFGDTIAATWSLADTVYLFNPDGERIRAVPLGSKFFKTPQLDPPPASANEIEKAQWLASFNYIGGVGWLNSTTLLVLYFELLPEEALGRRWHVVVLNGATGESIDIRDTPELLWTDPHSGIAAFRDPQSEEPNRWLIVRMR